jgi:hypothetical protein
MMNLKGFERKRLWPDLRHCTGIRLEGLSETTKSCQDGRSPGRDLKPVPTEQETGVSTA